MPPTKIGGNSKSSAVPPAPPAAQLKVGGAEIEREGVGEVTDPGVAADDAMLAVVIYLAALGYLLDRCYLAGLRRLMSWHAFVH